MRITNAQKEEAKSIDLHDFLLKYDPSGFKIESGGSIRPRMDGFKSISIKPGMNWYHEFDGSKDYATGDNIDFMMSYYGMSFQKAVMTLLDESAVKADRSVDKVIQKPKKIKLPECWPYDTDEIRKYLYEKRHIPLDTIYDLINAGLIYQEHSSHLVLVNYKKTYFQVRRTYGKGPKIIASGHVHNDDFWYLGMSGDTAYICEGAIDAISLYELLGRKHAFYISMGGVSNQAVIDRVVKDGKCRVVLCVDNDDDAGQKCRDRNPGLDVMIPPSPYKDWNEMLQAGATLDDTSYMRQVG